MSKEFVKCTGDSILDKTSQEWGNYFNLWWGLHKGHDVRANRCPLCNAEIYLVKTYFSEDSSKTRFFEVYFDCQHVWHINETKTTRYYCDRSIDKVERYIRKITGG